MTNNYMTTPTSPNSYITRKLNNMDEAKKFKKEQDVERTESNNRCTKTDIRDNEDSWRDEYNNHRNEGNNSEGQHQ